MTGHRSVSSAADSVDEGKAAVTARGLQHGEGQPLFGRRSNSFSTRS